MQIARASECRDTHPLSNLYVPVMLGSLPIRHKRSPRQIQSMPEALKDAGTSSSSTAASKTNLGKAFSGKRRKETRGGDSLTLLILIQRATSKMQRKRERGNKKELTDSYSKVYHFLNVNQNYFNFFIREATRPHQTFFFFFW